MTRLFFDVVSTQSRTYDFMAAISASRKKRPTWRIDCNGPRVFRDGRLERLPRSVWDAAGDMQFLVPVVMEA